MFNFRTRSVAIATSLVVMGFAQNSSAFLLGLMGANGGPCFGTSSGAVSAMREYLMRCGGRLSNRSGNIAINDFSVNPPMMFIMDQSMNRCIASIPITYGAGSQQTPPQPGNVSGENGTPAGFHITKPHNGERYQEHNSVGISGTGSENNATLMRGVVIHAYPPGNATWGCIGVPPEQFDLVKNSLSYGAVVYNHFAQMPKGTSSNNCTAPGTEGAGVGGARGTTGRN